MNKRYAVFEVEVTKTEQKEINLLFESDDYDMCWNCLCYKAYSHLRELKKYQLIEKDGTLNVRVEIYIDGRQFCKNPEEMGPDKYGYTQ